MTHSFQIITSFSLARHPNTFHFIRSVSFVNLYNSFNINKTNFQYHYILIIKTFIIHSITLFLLCYDLVINNHFKGNYTFVPDLYFYLIIYIFNLLVINLF